MDSKSTEQCNDVYSDQVTVHSFYNYYYLKTKISKEGREVE